MLNAEDTALVIADQITVAAAGAESEMHTVAAVKIEAVDERFDPMEVGSPMEEDELGVHAPTKSEPNPLEGACLRQSPDN